jgi:predicted lipoprotein with Yx(FWY)xxD motif
MCLLPAFAASLALAACGGSSYSAGSSSKSNAAATSASSAGAVVKTAANSTLGATVLTNAGGMTLYRLSGERAGSLICTSASCLQIWHPLNPPATGSPSTGVASLATIKRPDGSEQVAYKGQPLYTFGQDRQPGDVGGQGLKDVGTWNAVTVSAATTPATPAAGAESPPAESSGGYR